MRTSKAIYIVLISLLLFTTCSKDSSTSAPQNTNQGNQSTNNPPVDSEPEPNGTVIGTQGGEVVSADGIMTLNIPEGALSEEVKINIEIINEVVTVEGADIPQIGPTYQITPLDLEFDWPVEILFELPNISTLESTEAIIAIRADNLLNSISSKSNKSTADFDILPVNISTDKIIVEGISRLGYVVLQNLYYNLFTEADFGSNPWRNFTYKWSPSNKIIYWSFVPPDQNKFSYLTKENIEYALNLWDSQTSSFEFDFIENPGNANIVFKEGFDNDGIKGLVKSCNGATAAFYQEASNLFGFACANTPLLDYFTSLFREFDENKKTEIYLNSYLLANYPTPNIEGRFNAIETLSHEIGHILGIGHLNPSYVNCDNKSIMEEPNECDRSGPAIDYPQLNQWDINALHYHYESVDTNADTDNDGVLDADDKCPLVADPNQEDFDNDGIGDVCDDDDDDDGVLDDEDNCPLMANPGQEDVNENEIGDVCEDVNGNEPPSTPSNPSPEIGQEVLPENRTITWTGNDPEGDPLTYDVYFGTITNPPLVSENQSENTFDVSTLTAGQTYYWRIVVKDDKGNSTTSPIWNFSVREEENLPPPLPTNPIPSNGGLITNESSLSNVGWNFAGDPEGDAVRFDVYFGNVNPPPLIEADRVPNYFPVPELSSGSTYYWKVVVKDNQGNITEGPIWIFSVANSSPSELAVSTNEATNITPSSVTLNGTITQDGSSPILDTGFYISYDSTTPPTETEFDEVVNLGAVEGSPFAHEYFFPELGLTISYRAFAQNSDGLVLGDAIVTRYNSQPPQVTINQPLNNSTHPIGSTITISGQVTLPDPNSTSVSGQIFADGTLITAFNSTDFNFDWDTTGEYEGNRQITVVALDNLSQQGNAIVNINLAQTNSGNTGSFTDSRDGNTYKTIQIGNQIWMAENLKYLPSVTGVPSPTDKSYLVYDYNGTDILSAKALANYQNYGTLYNKLASKDACPLGWHIPSDNEWNTLIDYVVNNYSTGGFLGWFLMESGTTYWLGGEGNNQTGFSARGSGRADNFGFIDLKNFASFWSSYDNIDFHHVFETDRFGQAGQNSYSQNSLLSDFRTTSNCIRCIKD